jgi:hypothetical protein
VGATSALDGIEATGASSGRRRVPVKNKLMADYDDSTGGKKSGSSGGGDGSKRKKGKVDMTDEQSSSTPMEVTVEQDPVADVGKRKGGGSSRSKGQALGGEISSPAGVEDPEATPADYTSAKGPGRKSIGKAKKELAEVVVDENSILRVISQSLEAMNVSLDVGFLGVLDLWVRSLSLLLVRLEEANWWAAEADFLANRSINAAVGASAKLSSQGIVWLIDWASSRCIPNHQMYAPSLLL